MTLRRIKRSFGRNYLKSCFVRKCKLNYVCRLRKHYDCYELNILSVSYSRSFMCVRQSRSYDLRGSRGVSRIVQNEDNLCHILRHPIYWSL